jgi:predicted ABC-type transport system involved in lysophospholipase L1 biosynthesis ATPase subunit
VVATHDVEVARSMQRCVTLNQGELREGAPL